VTNFLASKTAAPSGRVTVISADKTRGRKYNEKGFLFISGQGKYKKVVSIYTYGPSQ
jgi:hypothetical protein